MIRPIRPVSFYAGEETECRREPGFKARQLPGRESLYKALAPGAKPRFDTVLKVARALGIRLSAHVV